MEKLKSTNATQNNAKPSPAAPPTASAASATRGPAQPVAPPPVTAAAAAAAAQPALSQLRAQMTAAPAVKPSGAPCTPLPPSAQPPPAGPPAAAAAPSSNVMQPRRSMGQPQQPPSLASGGQPSTNCDISNTTESNSHAMFQQIPNHRPMQQQPQSQPQAPMQAQPRGRSSAVMQQSIYQVSCFYFYNQGQKRTKNSQKRAKREERAKMGLIGS